jgi:hypothetical protein
MKSRDPLSELILRIHSATHDQAEWERVLRDISDLGMGEALAIGRVHFDSDRPEVVSAARFPEEFFHLIEIFEDPSEDFGIQSTKAIKCGEILTPSQMFDKKHFEQSRMYQDVCRKVDSYPYYIRRLFLGERDLYAFMANHEDKEKQFGRDHKSLLMMIIDHVELSLINLSKMNILCSFKDASLELINHVNIGVVLLSRNAEILFINQYAEMILSESDGLAVRPAFDRTGYILV